MQPQWRNAPAAAVWRKQGYRTRLARICQVHASLGMRTCEVGPSPLLSPWPLSQGCDGVTMPFENSRSSDNASKDADQPLQYPGLGDQREVPALGWDLRAPKHMHALHLTNQKRLPHLPGFGRSDPGLREPADARVPHRLQRGHQLRAPSRTGSSP